jgi:hypothetical protein
MNLTPKESISVPDKILYAAGLYFVHNVGLGRGHAQERSKNKANRYYVLSLVRICVETETY